MHDPGKKAKTSLQLLRLALKRHNCLHLHYNIILQPWCQDDLSAYFKQDVKQAMLDEFHLTARSDGISSTPTGSSRTPTSSGTSTRPIMHCPTLWQQHLGGTLAQLQLHQLSSDHCVWAGRQLAVPCYAGDLIIIISLIGEQEASNNCLPTFDLKHVSILSPTQPHLPEKEACQAQR